MVLRPVQKPYPPLWYGVTAPESTHWAALENAHMVTLLPTDGARAVIERFKAEWAGMGKSEQSLPLTGVMRLVVLADTDAEALSTAERAYASWLGHMRLLWDKHGMEFPLRLPPVIEPMLEVGAAFAGTAAGFRDFVSDNVEAIGANYMSCDVAFGDMTFAEAMQTTKLIGREVITGVRQVAAAGWGEGLVSEVAVQRIAPKPSFAIAGPVINNSIGPAHLANEITETEPLFVLAHVGVPRVEAHEWSLEICGLVDQTLSLSLEDLMRYPQRDVESIHKCAGNPFDPSVAFRQIANVIWRGVDVRQLLAEAGVKSSATHLWSYGLDYGEFFGKKVTHYVKDLPLSRVREGDVLIAHTLNDAPLSLAHGYPARLVVPGFYGTNSVKWICRLELADTRPAGPFTTELYNDPVEGGGTKPVWEIEPESIFVFPRPEDTLSGAVQKIWGRAWSSADVVSVEVSFDGGKVWSSARLTPRVGRAWQTFDIDWQPPASGKYRLLCRATDADGRKQPVTGARNAVYSVDVVAEPA